MDNPSNSSNSSKRRFPIGFWISALGSLVAAIGNTPSVNLPDPIEARDLLLVGNGLQILGSSIAIENFEQWNIRTGRTIKIIGNGISLRSLLEADDVTALFLNTQANLIQSVAGAVSLDFAGNLANTPLYNVGVSLLIIGNSLHALFNKIKLFNMDEGDRLVAVASWIKVVGAIIAALSLM